MTTLMTWGNSDGIKGRCDAKCHEAHEPECKCMCGGKFHGKANQPGGIEKALKDEWDGVLEKAQQLANQEGVKLDAREGAILAFQLRHQSSFEDIMRGFMDNAVARPTNR